MTNKEILKKKIIYRSLHRGTKEMDLLLGNFVKKYINKFSKNELRNLENLLFLDDEVISKWFFEKKFNNTVPKNRVTLLFKKFKL